MTLKWIWSPYLALIWLRAGSPHSKFRIVVWLPVQPMQRDPAVRRGTVLLYDLVSIVVGIRTTFGLTFLA